MEVSSLGVRELVRSLNGEHIAIGKVLQNYFGTSLGSSKNNQQPTRRSHLSSVELAEQTLKVLDRQLTILKSISLQRTSIVPSALSQEQPASYRSLVPLGNCARHLPMVFIGTGLRRDNGLNVHG